MKIKMLVGLTVVSLIILAAAGFLPCGIRLLFGIPCPMCGITRAYRAMLCGDFCGAFKYHPLFWLLPVGAVLLYAVKNKAVRRRILIIGAVLLAAVYVIRMSVMFPDEPPMDFCGKAVLVQLYERIFW